MVRNHNKNSKPYKRAKKSKVGKLELGMGTPKEHNYAHAPTHQPSIINHHLPNLQDGRSLRKHKNFEEIRKITIVLGAHVRVLPPINSCHFNANFSTSKMFILVKVKLIQCSWRNGLCAHIDCLV